MFNSRNREKTGLEKARDEALTVLDSLDPTDNDYEKTITHVKTLSDLIAQEADEKLSPNTLVLAFANVAGIAMIVGHERANIVTSKAIGFIGKLR